MIAQLLMSNNSRIYNLIYFEINGGIFPFVKELKPRNFTRYQNTNNLLILFNGLFFQHLVNFFLFRIFYSLVIIEFWQFGAIFNFIRFFHNCVSLEYCVDRHVNDYSPNKFKDQWLLFGDNINNETEQKYYPNPYQQYCSATWQFL